MHVIAHDGICPRDLIWYWHYNGSNWEGPVIIDSNFATGSIIAEDNNSYKCAIVINTENPISDNIDIAYYESQTEGAGWLDGSELGPSFKTLVTNYSDPSGPQAWPDMTGGYDNAGALHVAWVEQLVADETESVALRHWNNSRGTIRRVTIGDWPSPATAGAFNLNLAKVTLGFGDGSTFCQGGTENSSNYLYLLYTQYGGISAQESADSSLEGLYNGELYLITSRDGGTSWSVPENLTNTKTPKCNPGPGAPGVNGQPPRPDSVCRSEAWPSIGLAVSDIDIFFVSDLDAGGIPYGEGNWQMNPMMYLRLPGGTTDAQHLCPTLAPRLASSLDSATNPTGFQAYPAEMDSSVLHLANIGNAPLSGNVTMIYTNPASPPALWLTLDGATSPIPFGIAEGSPDSQLRARMDAAGIAVGTYEAEIRIAHNDTSQPTPVIYPVLFTVNACPCSCHTDPVCEGTTNILDVVEVIYVAFRAYASTTDPPCSRERTDVNCSGATDVLDVVHMVDVAFRAADAGTEFCHPCL